jgi:hypothetical protein
MEAPQIDERERGRDCVGVTQLLRALVAGRDVGTCGGKLCLADRAEAGMAVHLQASAAGSGEAAALMPSC